MLYVYVSNCYRAKSWFWTWITFFVVFCVLWRVCVCVCVSLQKTLKVTFLDLKPVNIVFWNNGSIPGNLSPDPAEELTILPIAPSRLGRGGFSHPLPSTPVASSCAPASWVRLCPSFKGGGVEGSALNKVNVPHHSTPPWCNGCNVLLYSLCVLRYTRVGVDRSDTWRMFLHLHMFMHYFFYSQTDVLSTS